MDVFRPHGKLCDFNSQPREGGWGTCRGGLAGAISFNSQPPEGGWLPVARQPRSRWKFQLTAARRRLEKCRDAVDLREKFQLTAARRRLGHKQRMVELRNRVSTHSRPKAAGILNPDFKRT